MLYLDTGTMPIRFILTYRRIMFLHYILNEDQESLICRFYKAQVKNPTLNDWSVTVENDLKELGISQSNEEIKTLKKEKFAEIVKQAVEESALQFLSSVKLKHTKVLHIVHTKLYTQEYLKPNKVHNINLSKFIFQLERGCWTAKPTLAMDTRMKK